MFTLNSNNYFVNDPHIIRKNNLICIQNKHYKTCLLKKKTFLFYLSELNLNLRKINKYKQYLQPDVINN